MTMRKVMRALRKRKIRKAMENVSGNSDLRLIFLASLPSLTNDDIDKDLTICLHCFNKRMKENREFLNLGPESKKETKASLEYLGALPVCKRPTFRENGVMIYEDCVYCHDQSIRPHPLISGTTLCDSFVITKLKTENDHDAPNQNDEEREARRATKES